MGSDCDVNAIVPSKVVTNNNDIIIINYKNMQNNEQPTHFNHESTATTKIYH